MSNKNQGLADKFAQLRNEILVLVKTVDTGLEGSALKTLTKRSLQLSAAFAGTNAGIVSGKNPYEQTNVKLDDTIQPLHDDQIGKDLSSIDSNVVRIKLIRSLIAEILNSYKIEDFPQFDSDGSDEGTEFELVFNYQSARQYLKVSSIQLGLELGRIRDERAKEVQNGK